MALADYAINRRDDRRLLVLSAVILVLVANPLNHHASHAQTVVNISGRTQERHWEYEPYDGWFNNLGNPEWGAVDTPLQRRLPPAYSDGVYQLAGQKRPNPLSLSAGIMKGMTGRRSYQSKTAMLVFFGQQVVEEILDAQRAGCPPEYANIKIPDDHEYSEETSVGDMPFLRTRYDMRTGQSPNNPRQQLNEITPYIDGGLIYGTSKAWADVLRSFKDGMLRCWDSNCLYPERNTIGLPMANPPPPFDHKLKSAKRFFMLGNPRGNENPFLLTMGVLWFREHNYWAKELKKSYAGWNDEQLYQRARQFTIAVYQNIVLYEWLPAFLGIGGQNVSEPGCPCSDDPGVISPYSGYKPHVHPGIVHAFQSAAMRFGHTMVPPGVWKRNSTCYARPLRGVRTCNSYWNPQDAILDEGGIDDVLMGMASQIAEREDNIITEDLRGKVFGPLEFIRRDLMALNIQRGRDHGLPDYNTARQHYGLRRLKFDDINPCSCGNSTIRQAVNASRELYKGDDRDIDIWVGGLLETTPRGPGPLFREIIKDQFERIRDGDRFWFENIENELFNASEIGAIRARRLSSVIVSNTEIGVGDIQADVFHLRPGDPCASHSFDAGNQIDETLLDACSPWATFDYFEGSAGPYKATFVAVGLYVLLLLTVVFVGIRCRRGGLTRRMTRSKSSGAVGDSTYGLAGSGVVRIIAEELKVEGEHTRHVGILVNESERRLTVVEPDSMTALRRIDLALTRSVEFHMCFDDDTLLLLRFPHFYDLVLQFRHASDRNFFVQDLKTTLSKLGIGEADLFPTRRRLLAYAFTKEDRQQLVEDFFRRVFKDAFGTSTKPENPRLQQVRGMISPIVSQVGSLFGRGKEIVDARDIMQCELTKSELASSLGMKPDSVFVEQIFKVVDETGSGTVAFQEMLTFLVKFAKGDEENKLRLIFRIYNTDGSGLLKRAEFNDMLKHLLEGAGTTVEDAKVDTTWRSMFSDAGLDEQNELTFEEFHRLFSPHMAQIMPNVHLEFAGMSEATSRSPPHTVGVRSPAGRRGTGHDGVSPSPRRKGSRQDNEDIYQKRTRSFVSAYQSHDEQARQQAAGPSIQISPPTVDEELSEKDSLPEAYEAWLSVRRFISNYQAHVFWLCLYHLVVFCIFAERAYYYSVEREHRGLRRIAGYGITVTRGAASAMMFTYSTLLVTMCRNFITRLRETPVNRFIPFDAAHTFHKVVAMTALLFTCIHIIGHSMNFYHISTQTADDLSCLFRNFYHYSDELPKFQYWMFGTLTGMTGFLLTLVVATMYIFALPVVRQYLYFVFWKIHQLYVVLYILLILHGTGKLVQLPIFQWYFLAPVVCYTLDRLISLSRKKVEITVLKAELLPSDVTHLQFRKPDNFQHKSGQWVRIACLALSGNEYHPFTLTSAPHEDTLAVHVRAVGPWTRNLRRVFDPESARVHRNSAGQVLLPKLHLDGPFGEGHQDWYKYSVSVLVGGGIGVTPFAAILKDIVHRMATNVKLPCKKVYFLWVTRTQRQFEWFTDIIRLVEEQDKKGFIDIHIFITQFYQKFDL
eukprot:scpid13674/ scgid14577/ Dual oxidase 1; Large NOX 1; Long NOX 1; NADPH thyroid oxidase 1; Thyroid oxidase 1